MNSRHSQTQRPGEPPLDTAKSHLDAQAAELLFELDGALGLITLNRPSAYNAINYAMRASISEAIPKMIPNPEIYALVIQSNSDKAFSAGADVREIVQCARKDIGAAKAAFKAEYTLNWQLESFIKPTVSLINGMVIGSGVGITSYGTHRVAGERYRFSMPETAIGLFPDVGVASLLANMPDEIGIYLGLSGAKVGRADAYRLGLATHCIESRHFEAIKNDLKEAQPVDPVLDDRHVDPGPGILDPLRETIASCFSAPAVEEIIDRLKAHEGENADWARKVAADLLTRSPTSLKVTLEHLRRARSMKLREILQVDYRLACRFLEGHDFYEGVRAALIDKDGNPNWQPATLEEVDTSQVEAYFDPMGKGEMVLPSREKALENQK